MENNKRRMPTGEGVMEDKKFNDIVYAYLQSISYKIEDISEYRFLYKSQLNYTRIARELKMNLKTCKSKIKYLFENGYIVEVKKDDLTIYELPNLGQYYFLIPNETLKYLVDTCNENIIITYAYLGQLKNALGDKAYFTKGRLLILLGYGKYSTGYKTSEANIILGALVTPHKYSLLFQDNIPCAVPKS